MGATQTNGLKDKEIDDYAQGLHPRNDIHWLYVSRKEGGRVHTSIVDCVDAKIQGLEQFAKRTRKD